MVIIWFFPIDCSFFECQNIAESSWYLMLLSPLPLIAALNQSAYMSVVLHEQKIFTLAVTALVYSLI
jgi:hypothetical protein